MDRGRVKPASGLNLRNQPNGDIVSVLTHDEEVTVVETVTFYRVKRKNGEIGFVHGDYLERLPELMPVNSNRLPSEDFTPIGFQHERFIGDILSIDEDFIPALEEVASHAREHDIKIWVTSSLRGLSDHVQGAIVTPATKSCHHIGHAIDMNIWFDGKLYNSKLLHPSNLKNQPIPVKSFIHSIQKSKLLRWGGDFSNPDPVHIDDNFYHQQTLLYTAKLQSRIRQLTS